MESPSAFKGTISFRDRTGENANKFETEQQDILEEEVEPVSLLNFDPYTKQYPFLTS